MRQRSRKNMEGPRRKPRRYAVHRQVRGVQGRSERKDISKGKASVMQEGERGTAFEVIQGMEEGIGVKP